MFDRFKGVLFPDDRSYDPELLKLMQTAFDDAWLMQHADGAFSTDQERQREHLAKAIFWIVDRGERDLSRIRSYALGELLRFRNVSDNKSAAG